MKKVLILFFLTLSYLYGSGSENSTPHYHNQVTSSKSYKKNIYSKKSINYDIEAEVIRVLDGDTIVISDGLNSKKLRLIGYDTPEVNNYNTNLALLAVEARKHLESLILNEIVLIEFDPINESTRHTDKFNRLLGYVYRASDGLFINAHMLERGFSKEYNKYPFSKKELFNEITRKARRNRVGVWKY